MAEMYHLLIWNHIQDSRKERKIKRKTYKERETETETGETESDGRDRERERDQNMVLNLLRYHHRDK